MAVVIKDHGLSFKNARTKRKSTTSIVIHHTASTGDTVESIHRLHNNNGWNGIGYNIVIYQDGTAHLGRGWEYCGAHSGFAGTNKIGDNYTSIGICCVGNYDVTTSIPDAQFDTLVEVVKLAQQKYPTAKTIVRHRDVHATACPGKYFPWTELLTLKTRKDEGELTMSQYTELKQTLTELDKKVTKQGYAIEETFETLSDIEKNAKWAVDTVKKLQAKKYLEGEGGDGTQLNLTYSILRMFVIMDRAGMFD